MRRRKERETRMGKRDNRKENIHEELGDGKEGWEDSKE